MPAPAEAKPVIVPATMPARRLSVTFMATAMTGAPAIPQTSRGIVRSQGVTVGVNASASAVAPTALHA